MQKRFVFVDGVRGFAALAIVLFHVLCARHVDLLPPDLLLTLSVGEAGVVIFFVISGFVITHSLLKANFGPKSIMRFVIGRSIRLDPPYWAAIILALSFSVAANVVIPGRIPKDYSFAQIIAHLFYVQELFGYEHINAVFWTLCYEIQFYLIIALAIAMRSPQVIVGIFVASLLWPLNIAPEFYGLFVNLFYTFLLGVGASYALRQSSLRPWYLLYAGIILIIGAATSNWAALASAAAGILLLRMGISERLSSALNWRWLQFVGMISYSLYLVHNPITGATFRIWYMVAGHSTGAQVVGLMLSFTTCIIFAWLFFTVIEKPCIALARAAAKKERVSLALGKRWIIKHSAAEHRSLNDIAGASTHVSLPG